MDRLTAIVHGRVQLVMYRDFTCRNARALGLVGEVKNRRDGTVFIQAEGPREKLDQLLLKLWKGSLLSNVSNVEATFSPGTGEFKTFRIVYD